MEDADHNIWVGGKNGDIQVYDKDKNFLGFLNSTGKLSHQTEYLGAIYALLQDKEGNIWMGTRNEGIIKLVPQGKLNFQLKYYKANPADIFSLNCNFIFSLKEDKQGRIWVGTLGGGLNQITKDANGNERFIHSGNKLSDYPSRFSRIKNICIDHLECVNDIICCGAKPIFFLDYIAIGKNEPEKVATLVSGVAEGCVQSGCALIGGETAEHPGTMSADDYDLAGFAVGIVDRAKIIDHDRMRPGDVVIALTSSGIHSNGYSLVRKVFNVEHADLGAYVDELGCTLGEELLRPTKIYVKPVLAAMDVADVHGVSHITGGGFYENIPRCIPDGLCAKIDKSSLRTPPIFSMLQRMGSIPEHDMFNTYNMGVGMTMIVAKDDADKALAALKENGQDAYVIGEVVSGEEKVALC